MQPSLAWYACKDMQESPEIGISASGLDDARIRLHGSLCCACYFPSSPSWGAKSCACA